MKYYFTTKTGTEKISSCDANCETTAAFIFAKIKKLNIKDFLNLFKIVK